MRIMRREKTAGVLRPGRKRARGFTLLEVLVAATLLLIALAGLVPFFIAGLNQSSSVRYKSTATNIAREKMEEIRQLDYREIVDIPFLEGRFGVAESVRGVVYNISYGVVESGYGSGILKEVTVTVDWDAPPKVSPVSLTTMIHQQYAGPRISRMEVHDPDPSPDPKGTPFDLLHTNLEHTVYCYVAEADWGLVIDNLNQAGMVARDVNLRLARVDDNGIATFFTDEEGDEELEGITWTLDPVTSLVNEVYIAYTFNSADIPDGYWEFRGMLFNQYDEPGNVWRLRLRVANDYPAAPSTFYAVPQFGDESIRLYWSGSGEKDIDHYCIQRRTKDGADWKSWEDVDMDIDADATSYLDQGSIAGSLDPWGTEALPQYYRYRIWAVDIDGNSGLVAGNEVEYPGAAESIRIPPLVVVTTTSTSTTLGSGTTTTEAGETLYTITIVNNVAESAYTILIEPGDGSDPFTVSVGTKSTVTVSDLAAGSYNYTGTNVKGLSSLPTVSGYFPLGPGYDPSIPVIVINK